MRPFDLSAYIFTLKERKRISVVENREQYKKRYAERDKYTDKYVYEFLKHDKNLSDRDLELALGAVVFLHYASCEGYCNIVWEALFTLSPAKFCEYVDAGYTEVSKRYPGCLREFTSMYNEELDSEAKEKQQRNKQRSRENVNDFNQ